MPSNFYLAVGFNGQTAVSNDGKKWTSGVSGNRRHNIFDVAFGPRGIAACGGAQRKFALHSTTGTKWEEADISDLPDPLMVVGYHKDRYIGFGGDAVTIGRANAYAATSLDGKKWTNIGMIGEGKRAPRAAASDGNRVVLVGDRGLKAVSTDLKTWKFAEDQRAVDTLTTIAFGNGRFVGGGLHGLRMHSADGLNWTRVAGEEGEHVNSVLWTGKEFVAVGLGATYRSSDGTRWTRTPNINGPLDAAYGPGGFVGNRWKGRLVHSPDAITWTEVAKFDVHMNRVSYGTT